MSAKETHVTWPIAGSHNNIAGCVHKLSRQGAFLVPRSRAGQGPAVTMPSPSMVSRSVLWFASRGYRRATTPRALHHSLTTPFGLPRQRCQGTTPHPGLLKRNRFVYPLGCRRLLHHTISQMSLRQAERHIPVYNSTSTSHESVRMSTCPSVHGLTDVTESMFVS
jgi:hypothetical protein